MSFVGPGTCVTSATVTALYYGGTTSMISGVSAGDAVEVYGNSPSLIPDGDVGVFGEVSQGMPIVNTGYLTGSAISATLVTKTFSSPSGSSSSSTEVDVPVPRLTVTHPQSASRRTSRSAATCPSARSMTWM